MKGTKITHNPLWLCHVSSHFSGGSDFPQPFLIYIPSNVQAIWFSAQPQNLILMANIWIVKATVINNSVLRTEACWFPVFPSESGRKVLYLANRKLMNHPDLPHPMSGRRKAPLTQISDGQRSVLASQPSFCVDRQRLPWCSGGCRSLWLGVIDYCHLDSHLSFVALSPGPPQMVWVWVKQAKPHSLTAPVVVSSSARCVQPFEIDAYYNPQSSCLRTTQLLF